MADNVIEEQTTPAEAETTERQNEHMIPKSRFDEVNNRLKTLEKQKQESEAAARELSIKSAEEQGRFKELYQQTIARVNELEQQAGSAERYQTVINNILEAQKKDVPEHVAALLEKLDPVDQLEWIAANADKLKPQAAQPAQAGQASFNPAGSKTNLTDRERIARLNNRRGVTSPF